MKIIFIILISILFNCFTMLAQTRPGRQVVAAAGENTVTPALSVSWTAGEVITGYASGAGLKINQGFQQPSLQVVSTEEAALREKLSLRIYPNPTASELHIERLSEADNAWNIQIFSVTGQHFPITNSRLDVGIPMISVDLNKLPAGQYFLQVRGEKPGETAAVSFQKIH